MLEDQARGVGGGVLAAVPVGQEGPVVVAAQADGGRVVVAGSPADVAADDNSATAPYLREVIEKVLQ